MGQDTGRVHLSQQKAVKPSDGTKGEGGTSSVLGAFFLAITLLIGTWTLLPEGKVNDRNKPASQLVNTQESGCSSTSGDSKSVWGCQPQSTTTTTSH
jgi:hypothetical protein